MYPRLLEIPLGGETSITIYSYGFMVAVAILTASWITGNELNRLQAEGRFGPVRVGSGNSGGKGDKKKKGGKKGRVIQPSELIGTMTIIAAVVGVAGSKLFHVLENLDQFMRSPADMVFSTGGLTFYGGLISAGLAIAWYAHVKGVHVPSLADAIAPSLILGYGIGRLGCHLAGDGDWGIASNMAAKPGFFPDWLWAETYPSNILGVTLAEPGPAIDYSFVGKLVDPTTRTNNPLVKALAGRDGLTIGIDRFGASAPAGVLAGEYGLTSEQVTAKIRDWLDGRPTD